MLPSDLSTTLVSLDAMHQYINSFPYVFDYIFHINSFINSDALTLTNLTSKLNRNEQFIKKFSFISASSLASILICVSVFYGFIQINCPIINF